MDEIDIKILKILQRDAKVSHKAIADELGVSTTPVYERIKKLEKKGIIESYVALLNPEMVGKKLTVFISAQLKLHNTSNINKFKKAIGDMHEVMDCFHIAGSTDFIIKLLVEDMNAYNEFVIEKLTSLDVVSRLESSFVLSTVKSSTEIYLN